MSIHEADEKVELAGGAADNFRQRDKDRVKGVVGLASDGALGACGCKPRRDFGAERIARCQRRAGVVSIGSRAIVRLRRKWNGGDNQEREYED